MSPMRSSHPSNSGRTAAGIGYAALMLAAIINLAAGQVSIRFGAGHWMGPATYPAGNVQAMLVGMPASPGFLQYTCQ